MNRYKLSKAGVDANEAIGRFNNNKEIYEKFLAEFLEDVNFQGLCEALQKEDVKEAFQCAHALKGIAGNLSFRKFHTDLIPLVEELRNGSLENADSLFAVVKTDYEEVIAAISN